MCVFGPPFTLFFTRQFIIYFFSFERAIRNIISHTHPERQTCLFSATWPEVIRKLAHEFLRDPIKVKIT